MASVPAFALSEWVTTCFHFFTSYSGEMSVMASRVTARTSWHASGDLAMAARRGEPGK